MTFVAVLLKQKNANKHFQSMQLQGKCPQNMNCVQYICVLTEAKKLAESHPS